MDEGSGASERVRLLTTNFFEGLGRGGMILQIPKAEASRSMREMKAMGSANSVSVGRYSGARGSDSSHFGVELGSDIGEFGGILGLGFDETLEFRGRIYCTVREE